MSVSLCWFRSDLRLDDNPAWGAATSAHERVIPVFVVDRMLWNAAGRHRRDQLGAHLRALDEALGAGGGRLYVVRGDPIEEIPALSDARGVEGVYWNGDVTRYAALRDGQIAAALGERAHRFGGRYVHPPGSIRTGRGDPYKVFTPFSRAWEAADCGPAAPAGRGRPTGDPGSGIPDTGPPLMEGGEAAARRRLEAFEKGADRYGAERNRPDLDSTSRLSADLKFGTLSPRTVVERIGRSTEARRAFVRQLCWRDFYAHLMAAFPETEDRAMRSVYDAIEWRSDPEGLEAWKLGETGYPIVDAGMRQLRSEGWMHNRVRLIAASFLVKDLLIDWRAGERYFRRLLVDADIPQNVGNWQWVAGTGADAAPYFRIFNPVSQGLKFDPDGTYVRRWVPEIRGLEAPEIHSPWEADPADLDAADLRLGIDYPTPIVDHRQARRETLDAYQRARQTRPDHREG